MTRTPPEDVILDHVAGWQVGHPSGVIVCSGCGSRVEADEDQLWTAYVTSSRNRFNQYGFMKPKCPDCDDQINTSTGHIDELIVTWRPTTRPGHGNQIFAEPVEVIDRAEP